MITAVDTSQVMKAVAQQIMDYDAVGKIDGVKVTRGEYINQDPSVCPWVGVYCIGEKYPVRTIAIQHGFRRQDMQLAIVCQESSRTSGEVAQDALGALKAAVMSAILSDPSFTGSVDTISDVAVIYASAQQQSADVSFQSAIITLTAVTQVDAS